MDALQQEVDTIKRQLDFQAATVSSIDVDNHTSIDRPLLELQTQTKLFTEKLHEMIQKQTSTDGHHVASIDIRDAELCTRADMDKMAEEFYTAIERWEDISYRRVDETYFPIYNIVG